MGRDIKKGRQKTDISRRGSMQVALGAVWGFLYVPGARFSEVRTSYVGEDKIWWAWGGRWR